MEKVYSFLMEIPCAQCTPNSVGDCALGGTEMQIQHSITDKLFIFLIYSLGCFKCGEDGHMARECPTGGGGGGGGGGGRGKKKRRKDLLISG